MREQLTQFAALIEFVDKVMRFYPCCFRWHLHDNAIRRDADFMNDRDTNKTLITDRADFYSLSVFGDGNYACHATVEKVSLPSQISNLV